MITITSRNNPLIKDIVKLHDAKGRTQEGLFIAEGLRICTTLMSSDVSCVYLLFTKGMHQHAQSLASDSTHVMVSDDVMTKISASSTPSGVLGIFKIPAQTNQLTAPGLVLAHISDPGNMGTLIRTAAAIGVRTVVVVEGCDPWSPKVVQASAGTLGMVSIQQWSWDQLIVYKKEMPLYALVVKDGVSINQATIANGLLVVGNEAHGIPEAWLDQCEHRITLPMPGGTESLNAAVAGSIALYMGLVKAF